MPSNSSLLSTHSLGSVELSPRVVSALAARLAADCQGVAGMSGRGLRDGLAELLNRENFERGIDLRIEDDGIGLDLFVIVEHGVRVLEVAHTLMSTVVHGLERHLGVRVLEINVNVQGIRSAEGSPGER
ncbi:MAG: Asp23/Gls24 family envelope stress response protein [Candidatus Dormibacteria bacterium]